MVSATDSARTTPARSGLGRLRSVGHCRSTWAAPAPLVSPGRSARIRDGNRGDRSERERRLDDRRPLRRPIRPRVATSPTPFDRQERLGPDARAAPAGEPRRDRRRGSPECLARRAETRASGAAGGDPDPQIALLAPVTCLRSDESSPALASRRHRLRPAGDRDRSVTGGTQPRRLDGRRRLSWRRCRRPPRIDALRLSPPSSPRAASRLDALTSYQVKMNRQERVGGTLNPAGRRRPEHPAQPEGRPARVAGRARTRA